MIAHARKAWLEGLSPKDNRTVPPLDYPLVYELKRAHPRSADRDQRRDRQPRRRERHLDQVDGVMIGRAAYQNPELLLNVDPWIFGQAAPVADAFAALEAYEPHVARELEKGVRLADMTRHLLGLFAGRPGARLYRQRLSTMAVRPGAGLETLGEAVAAVRRAPLAAAE